MDLSSLTFFVPPAPVEPVRAASSRAAAAAQAFEAVFIAQLLEPLFASVETPAIAGGGKSEAFFKGLLQENYAKAFAERGGFGLASSIEAALIDVQSTAPASPDRAPLPEASR